MTDRKPSFVVTALLVAAGAALWFGLWGQLLILTPGISPADALARWNENLCRRSLRGLFVTALVGRIVPSERRVETASAGHCPPWAVHGGTAEELSVASGLPMAILPAMML